VTNRTDLVSIGFVLVVFVVNLSTTLHARSLTYDTTTVRVTTESDTTLGQVTARIANTPVKRYMGLRHVNSLDTDAGMLFVYPESDPRNFTMEHMNISLDILYVDQSGRILSIRPVRPGISSVSSSEPARYVLEVNYGWSRTRNVQPGDRIQIEK